MKRPIVIVLLTAALLFVLAGIAAVVIFALNRGFPTNNPFDVRNVPSVLEESQTLKVEAGKPLTLKVSDDAGDVTITGADVETVQVKAVKTAYDSTQSRADEEVKGIKYTVEQTGNTINLKYELPKSMNFDNKVNTVDFVMTVPNEVAVNVNGKMGEVSVSSTQGNVTVTHDFGSVSIENIEGALSVQTNSGEVSATSIVAGSENIELRSDFGSISLKNANAKDIALNSNSGKITLSEVRATGDLTTSTDFGNTAFENGSAASLHMETNSGEVSLSKIKLDKNIFVKSGFGNISLEQALGASYELQTNSGAITVDGAQGELTAHTDFGGIKIDNAQAVTLDLQTKSGTVEFTGSLGSGPHTVQSDFGEIDLTLPADSKLNVDLSTGLGKIKSDLPITVVLNGSSNSAGDQINGSINGGGEQFTAKTNSGSITINASK